MRLDSCDDILLSEHIDSEDEFLIDSATDSGRKKPLNNVSETAIA